MQEGCGLRPYERHASCILSAIVIAIALCSMGRGELNSPVDHIVVRVVGAVHEVDIEVPRGATIGDVLDKVSLLPEADVGSLDISRRFTREDVLVVPYAQKNTVYVFGAVREAKVVVLEQGAQWKELLEQIELESSADKTALSRRKNVKNGSVVEIKKKSSKKSSAEKF